MTDAEILQIKLHLDDSTLNKKQKEEFLARLDNFYNVFSLRDEMGTCPFTEVHLKLKDETPFCNTISHAKRTKKSYTKRNG